MTGESPVISWNSNRTVREKMDGPQGLIVSDGTVHWQTIDWPAAYRTVRTLRRRIYRATEMRDWKTVRSLQKLMLRSRANLLVSIRAGRPCEPAGEPQGMGAASSPEGVYP